MKDCLDIGISSSMSLIDSKNPENLSCSSDTIKNVVLFVDGSFYDGEDGMPENNRLLTMHLSIVDFEVLNNSGVDMYEAADAHDRVCESQIALMKIANDEDTFGFDWHSSPIFVDGLIYKTIVINECSFTDELETYKLLTEEDRSFLIKQSLVNTMAFLGDSQLTVISSQDRDELGFLKDSGFIETSVNNAGEKSSKSLTATYDSLTSEEESFDRESEVKFKISKKGVISYKIKTHPKNENVEINSRPTM